MKRLLLSFLLCLLSVPLWAESDSQDKGQSGSQPSVSVGEPQMLGPHLDRDTNERERGGNSGNQGANAGHAAPASPNMTWHNGAIMPTASTTAIFWGKKWGTTSFAGDKITGLDTFYWGVGGSKYAGTVNEYTGTGGQVTSGITYTGHYIDYSSAPSRAPNPSSVLNEVCTVLKTNHVTPAANNYYAVYVDTPRGNANYCAWHSYSTCSGVPVQFAFFFNLDGDPGCDPQDTSGLHSQGLAALANVTGHELSEARSDPRNGGWYDSSGAENADKCAWTFGAPLLTLSNGSQWKIQGNWSNAAYTAVTGYPNLQSQKGCLGTQ